VKRIEEQAVREGRKLRTDVFLTKDSWRKYAIESLFNVQGIASKLGCLDRLHLWPDPDLTAKKGFLSLCRSVRRVDEPADRAGEIELLQKERVSYDAFVSWVHGWWNRIYTFMI